ncbi:MAG TPA: sigma-70 family RNA polymerase sigma factor [Polyangiaceae bacterium]|nr:sigma-70 family RNA polymerase sigma factor [Polyangiaceae bacterium]
MPDAPAAENSPDLRALFTMHAPYVWNSLRRLGVPPADLEDLTHDVFIQVQGHLGEYDPTRAARPWLFGFAFRIASQYRRRAYRRHETSAEVAAAKAVDPAALPDQRIAIEQDRRLVLEALEAIPLERRAVLVLYEIDGVSMEEIARTLGIPVNTAYSRLRTARAEFATAVKRLRRGQR